MQGYGHRDSTKIDREKVFESDTFECLLRDLRVKHAILPQCRTGLGLDV